MNDLSTYRTSLITVKNLIDAYKKNKLTIVIFSLLFFAGLLGVVTLLLLKLTLNNEASQIGPSQIAMLTLLVMLVILFAGYWIIFNNPSVNVKRKVLREKVSAELTKITPRLPADKTLLQNYINKRVGEHDLLNWVLVELRTTETL